MAKLGLTKTISTMKMKKKSFSVSLMKSPRDIGFRQQWTIKEVLTGLMTFGTSMPVRLSNVPTFYFILCLPTIVKK